MSLLCEDDGKRLDCIDSRMSGSGKYCRRTYKCASCGRKYSTTENFIERNTSNVPIEKKIKPYYLQMKQLKDKISTAMEEFDNLTK